LRAKLKEKGKKICKRRNQKKEAKGISGKAWKAKETEGPDVKGNFEKSGERQKHEKKRLQTRQKKGLTTGEDNKVKNGFLYRRGTFVTGKKKTGVRPSGGRREFGLSTRRTRQKHVRGTQHHKKKKETLAGSVGEGGEKVNRGGGKGKGEAEGVAEGKRGGGKQGGEKRFLRYVIAQKSMTRRRVALMGR